MCSAPSVFPAQAEALWDFHPTQSTQGLPTGRLEPTGALGAAVSHTKQAPNSWCTPQPDTVLPHLPPGWAPLLRARDDVPRGAVLGPAPLAHWQDFAAVCSETVILVTEETCRKQHCWWIGSDRALGRGEAGLGEGGALFSPPISPTCEGRWVPAGPGHGSIPSCHGDTGCILRQARASPVQPRMGVPPVSIAAVPGECRAGARFGRWAQGTERWDSAS